MLVKNLGRDKTFTFNTSSVPRGVAGSIEFVSKVEGGVTETITVPFLNDPPRFVIPGRLLVSENLPAQVTFKVKGITWRIVDLEGPAAPPSGGGGDGGPASWADILNKPSTFTPSAHAHVINDVTGLQSALNGKASTAALAAKADATALTSAVSSLNGAIDTKANASEVTTALSGKANSVHGHAITDVTNLLTVLQTLDGQFVALASSKMDTEFALEELDKKADKSDVQKVVVSATAPTDLTAVWVDIS